MRVKALLVLMTAALTAVSLTAQDDGANPRRGRRARGEGAPPWAGRQDGASRPTSGPSESRPAEAEARKSKRGIPVTDPLVIEKCQSCHKVDENGHMTRISYMRKGPEGWQQSLQRMGRIHGVTNLTVEDAKHIVAYLSNDHGLTRAEAQKALYDAERRVHYSEAGLDADLKATCGACHSVGRAFAQQRDEEEWKILKTTHVAMFPLVSGQAFRGEGRGMGGGGQGRGGGNGPDFSRMSEAEMEEFMERQRAEQRNQPDRADKVLEALGKAQPLFSADWEDWSVSRREVPLTGSWSVTGHEASRGDFLGTLTLTRTAKDTYTSRWDIAFADGKRIVREGQGVLYAGYSWRGRTKATSGAVDGTRELALEEDGDLREVLLLNEDWTSLSGRFFTGGYDEIGADVTLTRNRGTPEVLGVEGGALRTHADGQSLTVLMHNIPDDVSSADFHLGAGINVVAATKIDAQRVRLTVDVAWDAELGVRRLAFRASPGDKRVTIYDAIDYLRVEPVEGFARVGRDGEPRDPDVRPKQRERLEAVAMCRGKDGKPNTADDLRVGVVPARWSIAEMPVRENDDDAAYVGTIDATTGRFTPAMDGPNPNRKGNANNIGDIFVVAEADVVTAMRPAEPSKPTPESGPASKPTKKVKPESPPVVASRTFKVRSHLLVSVPIFVRWDRLEWESR